MPSNGHIYVHLHSSTYVLIFAYDEDKKENSKSGMHLPSRGVQLNETNRTNPYRRKSLLPMTVWRITLKSFLLSTVQPETRTLDGEIM